MKYIEKQEQPPSLSDYINQKKQEGDYLIVFFALPILIPIFKQKRIYRFILQFLEYYQQIRPKYRKYSPKNDLRNTLLQEQGYICCYCLGTINIDKMSIEHWLPKTEYKVLELEYSNLLGSCLGNGPSRRRNKRQHCTASKAEITITINPTDNNCESLIKYSSSGKIYSDNEKIDRDLRQTLNLNLDKLVDIRRRQITIVEEIILNDYPNGNYTTDDIQSLIEQLYQYPILSEDGKYEPYCLTEIGYLKTLIMDLKS
ncbi:retron system putative HNH endonuclease [Crocosphaera sp. XPORK-15E]|uniref:retron system putative HNH endonuclease n=1 Tax=Crocosphaera sp. XPORK-15E TaxID=3110247 RepID=UPI002B21AE35|nr:retron system putative HNH endonuclease [Crocosphaera sp. XPORK-15E]MEA5534395.1 retron system putative HNH endonuclease [Crocosphaera sp. XPORK-15E]